jgi:hypothetical protein
LSQINSIINIIGSSFCYITCRYSLDIINLCSSYVISFYFSDTISLNSICIIVISLTFIGIISLPVPV